MDWSRAKTILIISFALLNLLLGYQLWVGWNEQSEAYVVHTQTVEQLDQLLAAEQIELNDTLPMDLPKAAYLQIDIVHQDKTWQPLSPPVALPPGTKSHEDVTEALQAQIKALSEYEWDRTALPRGKWLYYQRVMDFPVFAAPLEFKRSGSRLTAWRRTAVKVTSKEQANVVIAPHAALQAVIEAEMIPPGSTVDDVRLGYIGQLDAEQPRFLVPVWRIFVIGHEPLYVNALTGGLESGDWTEEE